MKLKKLIFTFVVITLLITTSVLPAFAYVPTGKSGVNFAEIYDGVTTLACAFPAPGEDYFTQYQDPSTYGARVGGAVGYYQSVGGTDTYVTPRQFILPNGARVSIYILLDDLYSEGITLLFRNLNFENYYYMACAGTFTNTTTSERAYLTSYAVDVMNISETEVYMHTAGASDGFKMSESLTPLNTSLDVLRFVFENNTGEPILFNAFQISGVTIQQENYIRAEEKIYATGEVLQTTQYVPFNLAYFSSTDAEQDQYNRGYNRGYRDGFENGEIEGYNTGYTEGATDAGGEPIQRWGAFLLSATTGFLSFEIFPGFPLWGLLGAVIAIPLAIALLKIFAGG